VISSFQTLVDAKVYIYHFLYYPAWSPRDLLCVMCNSLIYLFKLQQVIISHMLNLNIV